MDATKIYLNSFPGGNLHLNEDIVQGALRETEEEIGICSNSVEIWGSLPPIFKVSGTK